MVQLNFGVWAEIAQRVGGPAWRIQDAGTLVWCNAGDGWKAGCAGTVG